MLLGIKVLRGAQLCAGPPPVPLKHLLFSLWGNVESLPESVGDIRQLLLRSFCASDVMYMHI